MKKLILFLLLSSGVFAGSIRLYNDSSYKLRAVIRSGDGTYLGEMVVLPEHFNTWSDSFPSFGPGGQSYSQNPIRSQTPYVIHWICLNGDEFGISTNIPTGGAAIAESSEGVRYCKPPAKKPESPYGPYGPHPDDEQLHYQNEAPEAEGSVSPNSESYP